MLILHIAEHEGRGGTDVNAGERLFGFSALSGSFEKRGVVMMYVVENCR
jgi:hypothetical protein